jgi:hypothetical protein
MKNPSEPAVPIEVVFFDIRDTLGEVDRPGHLVPYAPSTEKLLTSVRKIGCRIGVITNLPENISADQGRRMVTEAVLTQATDGRPAQTIGDFIDSSAIITNKDGRGEKPDPTIYRYAAEKMGVDVTRCMFVGENLIEVLGASRAGMQWQLKPVPPGREFLPPPQQRRPVTPTDSGRAFEQLFEQEHLLGERIFACGEKIVQGLDALNAEQDRLRKETDDRLQRPDAGLPEPKAFQLPANLKLAMGIFVYLIDNFADQVHLRAEEAVIPIATARGLDSRLTKWVFNQHEQARAYFRALDIAWQRINTGDRADALFAVRDFRHCTHAFVVLFKHHAIREDNQLYKIVGEALTDTDDSLLLNIASHTGPADITPYFAFVRTMEEALGIPAPA